MQKEIGFRYILMHGLLHDVMARIKSGPTEAPIYNWQYIDKLYGYLLTGRIETVRGTDLRASRSCQSRQNGLLVARQYRPAEILCKVERACGRAGAPLPRELRRR